jgi:hypothetical protein
MDLSRRTRSQTQTPRLTAVLHALFPVFFLVASTIALGPSPARAETEAAAPAIAVPTVELRFMGGFGVGAEAAGSLFDHRLRLDGSVRGGPGAVLGEGAVQVRVVGPAASALWLRGGYLFQGFNIGCSIVDRATALDAGLAYRKRWAGGSLFVAETGIERVTRPTGLSCNDSVLGAESSGLRVSVGGQYALTRGVGLYGRIGVRTGQHIMEIAILPEAWIGLAFEM